MSFIIKNVKWVMLVSGVLTATMFYGLFAPQAALESMFGASFDGTLQNIVIRSWSALIGLIGVILIYGFLNENIRKFSIAVASFSKLVFVLLVLLFGQEYIAKVVPALAMDVIVVAVAAVYLLLPAVEKNA